MSEMLQMVDIRINEATNILCKEKNSMLRAIACDRALFWCKALYSESIWYSEMFAIVKQKEQKKKSVSFPIQLFQTHDTFFCALQPPRKPPSSLDKFTTDNYGRKRCFFKNCYHYYFVTLWPRTTVCAVKKDKVLHTIFGTTKKNKTIYSHRLFRCLKEHFRKSFLPKAITTSH